MYRDKDFDLKQELPPHAEALTQDLELNRLLEAMAKNDKFLFEVANKAVLLGLTDLDTVIYRQSILKDCLKNTVEISRIYAIATETLESREIYSWGFSSRYPHTLLYASVESMQIYMKMLKKLRRFIDDHASKFESEGFKDLFTTLQKELSDDYFIRVFDYLKSLKLRGGTLISAQLGEGNKGVHYRLHKLEEVEETWWEWLVRLWRQFFPEQEAKPYTYYLPPQDEAGARALEAMRDRGINVVAHALTESVGHIHGFFKTLQTELAFYIGCLNLHEQLTKKGLPVCFPKPMAIHERRHSFTKLYDPSLALTKSQNIVGNAVSADNKNLVIITGANQGGKSTLLRGVGLAQCMMQCGMFVPAAAFSSNICDGIFTHYKREEDPTMERGKLDEELSRMNVIVENLTSNSMLLCNESFAATNEREGSEIARQVTTALMEKGIKIFFVTHHYDFAHSMFEKKMEMACFLRAERKEQGERTYKLIEGEPLPTSFGSDLYKKIFG